MAKNRNATSPKEAEVLHPKEVKVARQEVDNAKMQIAVAEYRHSGPIPDPMTLKGYNDVCPGAADRIIAMAETQAKHRQEMEKTVVNSRSSDSKLVRTPAYCRGSKVLTVKVDCIKYGLADEILRKEAV